MNLTEKRALLEALTSIGIHIIPIWWVGADGKCACGTNCGGKNRGKHPLPGVGWPDRATTDLRKIDNWLASYPDANWGVLTGVRSNIFVVDVDAKSGGDEGLAQLLDKHGPLPPTLEVKTGGGGRHFYFVMPKDTTVQTRIGMVQGIDIKGEGNSQVVAPPSIHQSGNTYEWTVGPGSGKRPAEAPQWLLDKILKEQKKGAKAHQDMGGVAKLGTRDDVIFHNALSLLKQGVNVDLAVNAVWAWVEAGGVEQTPQDMIDRAYVESKVQAAASFLQRSDGNVNTGIDSALNDAGNALRLATKFEGTVIHGVGVEWLVWSGKHWKQDAKEKQVIHASVQHLTDKLNEEITTAHRQVADALRRWLQASLNIPRLVTTLRMLSTLPSIRTEVEELDSHPYLLNFTNGALDLRTGKLLPHDKVHLLTKLLPFDYDPDAKCPMWERTVEFAFGGNLEAKEYFRRALGYSLTGVTSEQCIFICWGEAGNNGKSTLLNAVDRILGDQYSETTNTNVFTQKNLGSTEMSNIADMRAARIVFVSELSGTMSLNEEFIKVITGGEKVLARHLYSNSFQFVPQFKVWIMTNERPIIRGSGDPIWRRIKLIPFELVIPPSERLPRHVVDAALDAERAGIVAWTVRGCLEWMGGGIAEPTAITSAVKEYRVEMDTVSTFLTDEYERDPKARVALRDIYPVFLNWCKNNGIRNPASSISIARRLHKIDWLTFTGEEQGHSPVVAGIRRREFTFGPDDLA